MSSLTAAPKFWSHARVIDLTGAWAWAWATQLWADLGADVLKVGHPQHGIDRPPLTSPIRWVRKPCVSLLVAPRSALDTTPCSDSRPIYLAALSTTLLRCSLIYLSRIVDCTSISRTGRLNISLQSLDRSASPRHPFFTHLRCLRLENLPNTFNLL